MLGTTLDSQAGSVNTAEVLKGKTVAIYFSAHWCPPCRGFTPKLSEIYKSLKASGKEFEIVFCSSDRSDDEFRSYFNSMPWLALPFADRTTKDKLARKFGVSGIPKLVILDAQGSVITTEGRQKILEEPSGGAWLAEPKSSASPAAEHKPSASSVAEPAAGLAALLGSTPVLGADGTTKVDVADVTRDSPLFALYFSAHWCGPCRGFTPKLVAFVKALKEEQGVDLPVIFGSSDSDAAAFASYHAEMGWHAFPFGDERIEALKKKFQVSGIPWLVVLDEQGRLVMNEADVDVPKGPAQAYPKWLKMAKTSAAAA